MSDSIENSEGTLSWVGQKFEGRFEILSVLGQGGVGVVYKARQLHMDKIVAIKMLTTAVAATDESFRRFEQEARAASSLSHHNIISVYDFGKSQDGRAYLVMEYLGDRTLDHLLDNGRKLDIDLFLRIFTQVCDGLHHAHKKGIVHRDIKPSNIMLIDTEDASNVAKIVDFGLVKLTAGNAEQHLTKTGMVVGTPLFMSPEQLSENEIDLRSDIYSLGCVMYNAITGRLPHVGHNTLSTLFKHVNEAPAHFLRLPEI